MTAEVSHAEAKAAAADADEIQLTFLEKAKALRGALQPAYWQALIVVSLLYFARFDASFITLRARTVSALSPISVALAVPVWDATIENQTLMGALAESLLGIGVKRDRGHLCTALL